MRSFSKVVLRWAEPEAFRENQDRLRMMTERWWLRPLFLLILTMVSLMGWDINKLNPHRQPLDFLTVFTGSLIVGFVFFYILPWLLRLCPSTVVLYSNGIMKMGEQSVRYFSGMSGYSWLEEGTYYILRLRTKGNKFVLYGVPNPVIRQKIDEALQGRTRLECQKG